MQISYIYNAVLKNQFLASKLYMVDDRHVAVERRRDRQKEVVVQINIVDVNDFGQIGFIETHFTNFRIREYIFADSIDRVKAL